ncbi:MAG: hypothetical protein HY394_00490 [Candidatus Diapherotrites archaeon]|nr:hypothetical protein [Candidatus Diapherotrites archaeon]
MALKDFFSGLFRGRAGETPAEKKVSLKAGDVAEFLESETAPRKEELQKRVAMRFAEIKHLLRAIESGVEGAKSVSLEEKQNEQLKKIVSTSSRLAMAKIGSLAKRLEPPKIYSMEEAAAYSRESFSLVNREIFSAGKNIAYSTVYLKDELKEIGSHVAELQDIFSGLNAEFAKNENVFLAGSAKKAVEDLLSAEQSHRESIAQQQKLMIELKEIEDSHSENLAKVNALQKSEEFSALASVREKKAELEAGMEALKEKATAKILSAEKPLRKFTKLAKAKHLLAGEMLELAEMYVARPFNALQRDPKGEHLKKIAAQARKSIEEGSISFKAEAEKEKRLLELRQLEAFDFFENIFWEMNRLKVGLAAAEKQLNDSETAREMAYAERKASDHEKDIAKTTNGLAQLKSEQFRLKSSVEQKRESLQAIAKKISGKEVVISSD